jgi:chromosome segregation ATPase
MDQALIAFVLALINLVALIIASAIYDYNRRHDKEAASLLTHDFGTWKDEILRLVKRIGDIEKDRERINVTFNTIADDSGDHYKRILELEKFAKNNDQNVANINNLFQRLNKTDAELKVMVDRTARDAGKGHVEDRALRDRVNDVLNKYVKLDERLDKFDGFVNSSFESHSKTLDEILNGMMAHDQELNRLETHTDDHVEGLASRLRSVESFNDVVASQLKLITKELAQCRYTASSSKGPSAKQPSSRPSTSKKSSPLSRTKTPKRSSTTSTAAKASSKKKSPKS